MDQKTWKKKKEIQERRNSVKIRRSRETEQSVREVKEALDHVDKNDSKNERTRSSI